MSFGRFSFFPVRPAQSRIQRAAIFLEVVFLKKKGFWMSALPDALLCAGAVCIVAGAALLWGAAHGLLTAGALSILYGVLAARSGGDGA